MNRDDIIRMAREAGWVLGYPASDTVVERFAKLVAANDTALLRQALEALSWTRSAFIPASQVGIKVEAAIKALTVRLEGKR